MGEIYKPTKAKLIIGMFSNDESLFKKAQKELEKKYGKVDFESGLLDFNFTDYYQKELGENLKKKFISFKKMIDYDDLPDIKISTNKIEDKFIKKGRRKINIDPGYLTLAKLVLATTKDHVHRIYLYKGIYAEVTLHYKNKSFRPWSWTYPDYRSRKYREIFEQIRNTIK